MFKFNQGDIVKDRLTDFVGTVTSRTEFYNGCIRYGVTAKELYEGKSIVESFDEEQLELVSEPARSPVKEVRPGGPHNTPTMRSA